ncbi:MAG TPA: DUF2079 domain-containing protein [Thermoanaerobaculia bacterium]
MIRSLMIVCAAITAAFIITGPWQIGPVTVKRLEVVLSIWLLAVAALLLSTRTRDAIGELLQKDIVLSRRTLAVASVIVFAFVLRVTTAKYFALEVNAWDFSLSFDRPIERTLHGELLWSDDLRRSTLGVHGNWLLLAFVPLYAVVASPWWLIVAQSAAIAAAVLALFHFVRSSGADDFIAAAIALAFLLNRYTAHATQFVFTIDIAYPVALFVLFYAFVRRRTTLFTIALLITISIKEDAIVPLTGFVLVALAYRRWWTAAVTMGAAVTAFVTDYFFVLPGLTQWSGAAYALNWASYGKDPLAAAMGMLRSPLRVIARVLSGSIGLFASLDFVPVAGWPWILAALPPLIILGGADADNVHFFTLHYALPVLPALFASVPFAVARFEGRRARRGVAFVVLATCALAGSTYELPRPRAERVWIARLIAATTGPVYVQGALVPHAGYETRVRALHHDVVPPRDSSYLLCMTCNPYPFSRDDIAARIDRLRYDSRYEEIRARDILLFRRKVGM